MRVFYHKFFCFLGGYFLISSFWVGISKCANHIPWWYQKSLAPWPPFVALSFSLSTNSSKRLKRWRNDFQVFSSWWFQPNWNIWVNSTNHFPRDRGENSRHIWVATTYGELPTAPRLSGFKPSGRWRTGHRSDCGKKTILEETSSQWLFLVPLIGGRYHINI